MSNLERCVFWDATIRGGFTVGSALSYNFYIDKLAMVGKVFIKMV